MRKVNLFVLAAATVSVLVALAWARGSYNKVNVEEEIRTLQAQELQARLKGDTSFFEKYYADAATIIHNDGTVSTKAQEIANLKSGSQKYESISVNEQKIHTYGDTAVVNSESSVKATTSGKPNSGDVRTTRVWVKQQGNWKVVLYQITRVAPASQ